MRDDIPTVGVELESPLQATAILESLLNRLFDNVPNLSRLDTEVVLMEGDGAFPHYQCQLVLCPNPEEERKARAERRYSPIMAVSQNVRAVIHWGLELGTSRKLAAIFEASSEQSDAIFERIEQGAKNRALLQDLNTCKDGRRCTSGWRVSWKELLDRRGKGRKRREYVSASGLVVEDQCQQPPKGSNIRDVAPIMLEFSLDASPLAIQSLAIAASHLGTSFGLTPLPPNYDIRRVDNVSKSMPVL